jgi:glutathione peroxidase
MISRRSVPAFARGDKPAAIGHNPRVEFPAHHGGNPIMHIDLRLLRGLAASCCLALFAPMALAADACPAWLNQERRMLHSEKTKNLCAYSGKPILIVNTASHCGFTKQFKELDALYREYHAKGLEVVGFSSNDFKQEAGDEAEAAKVCFVNFGVSFDMYAPVVVSGDKADPIFKELARQGGGYPRWNFYKYLVDRNGVVVERFSSFSAPDSKDVRAAIEKVLAAQ